MISFIILTKTNNQQIYQMTNNLIQSLKNTTYSKNDSMSQYRIVIIQSQKDCKFKYDNVITLQFDRQIFNYNHALNQGLIYCLKTFQQNDWFCCMNNDLICDKNWIIEIKKVFNQNSNILSFCPKTPYLTEANYEIGYILGKHMVGYCFMFHKYVLTKVKIFDQLFNFYFQDDDYIQQLRINKIFHASVKNSLVTHIGQKTEKTNIKQLLNGRNKFIFKYSIMTYFERQIQKNKNSKINLF